MDYVVGKKYTKMGDDRTIEVLHVTDKNVLVKLHFTTRGDIWEGKEVLWEKKRMIESGWYEYIPPVVQSCTKKVVLSLIQKDNMDLVKMDFEDDNKYWKVIGTVKFTAIDGKLTGVEILP